MMLSCVYAVMVTKKPLRHMFCGYVILLSNSSFDICIDL